MVAASGLNLQPSFPLVHLQRYVLKNFSSIIEEKKSLRTLWHKCFCNPSMVLNQPGYITSIIPCSFQNVNFPWLKYYSRTFPWTWRRFPQNISWPVATLLQMQKLNHELDQRWIRGFHTLNILAFWVQFKGKQCSVWVVEWIIRYVSQRFVRTTSQS